MPVPGPDTSKPRSITSKATMTVSKSRRAFSQSLLVLPAAVSPKLHAAPPTEAKKLFIAYAPYKLVGHRIETSVFHPWVIGFRRHPFMRDFWKYVDIDPEGRGGSAA
jgi:hypothetical protein